MVKSGGFIANIRKKSGEMHNYHTNLTYKNSVGGVLLHMKCSDIVLNNVIARPASAGRGNLKFRMRCKFKILDHYVGLKPSS
jgi:hypothetical protein